MNYISIVNRTASDTPILKYSFSRKCFIFERNESHLPTEQIKLHKKNTFLDGIIVVHLAEYFNRFFFYLR